MIYLLPFLSKTILKRIYNVDVYVLKSKMGHHWVISKKKWGVEVKK
jgi:hypothetical protein